MDLDLVDRRDDVGLGGQPLQVRDLEVRDADRAGAAVGLELLERLPGRDEVAVVAGRQRPVDQEQVDVVGAELLERRLERRAGVVGLVEAVVELAGDEDVVAVDARAARCPRRRPPRSRTSRRCRCGGSRSSSARCTASAVSRAAIWKTPKPSCGIVLPSFRVTFGTVVIGSPYPQGHSGDAGGFFRRRVRRRGVVGAGARGRNGASRTGVVRAIHRERVRRGGPHAGRDRRASGSRSAP